MSDQSRVLAGRYRVDATIGHGGMATVYEGFDQKLGRTVAIKILDKDLSRDATFRTRFRMEAQAASRMSHPSIVRVYDAGEDVTDGAVTPFIIMELVRGRTLKEIIAEAGPTPDDAVHYVSGILEALEYSHRAGVIHRDIKPGNIMITAARRVKVMDFGIARAVSDSSSTVAETTSILGTAAYFSPEQAKGEPVDARTDLYSTGVVLYEMLAGRQPFRGDSPVAVAYQHVSEAPVPPSQIDHHIPRSLDAVVLRAMAKDPFSRYPDAATFRTALVGTAAGKVPSQRQLDQLTNDLYGANPRAAAETARSLRQMSSDTGTTRTQQGPPVAWIWATVAVISVLLVSVLIWAMSFKSVDGMSENSREVPSLANMTYDEAVAALDELDLVASRGPDESSSSVDEGDVVRTVPEAGLTVAKGETITVYVSSGASTATVPTLVDLAEETAKEALAKAGLNYGSIKRVNNPDLAAGTVISSSPATGEEVEPGTVVNLEIATGKVTVKNYAPTFTLTSAVDELQGPTLKLVVQVLADIECTVEDVPMVKSQDQVGDVPIGSTVQLHVCVGTTIPEGLG